MESKAKRPATERLILLASTRPLINIEDSGEAVMISNGQIESPLAKSNPVCLEKKPNFLPPHLLHHPVYMKPVTRDPISTQFPSIRILKGKSTSYIELNTVTAVPASAPKLAPTTLGSRDASNQPKKTPAITEPIRAQPVINRNFLKIK